MEEPVISEEKEEETVQNIEEAVVEEPTSMEQAPVEEV